LYRLKATMTSLRLGLRNVGYMVRVGAPGLVGEVAVAVMMAAGNRAFMHHVGDEGVAAYSIACYLFPLVYMVCNAVAQSAQPIISYNHGAGAHRRVNHTVRFSMAVSVAVGLAVSLLFFFFSPQMVLCFLDQDVPAYTLAAEGLPYYGAGFLFLAVNICAVGYLQSIEKSGSATVFTLLRGVLFLVAAYILLPRLWGTAGLWLSVPCAELLTALVIIIYAFAFPIRKKHNG
jgi:Na+-driven multidrug efflux pump